MTDIKQSGAARWAWDAEGVVTITLDDPGRTANMLNRRHYEGLNACLDDLTGQLAGRRPAGRRDRLRGVVLTSAKRSFVAGPEFEPGEITAEEAATTYDLLVPLRDQARRLETLGRPVAAALNGSALGGGFEIALACHYRAGSADPSVIWSLAETGMGIMPGGGGVVRVTRMAGIAATVLDIVGPGTAFHPAAALAAGLVDELSGDVVAAARAWVLAQPEGPFVQRWERPGYAIPGGTDEPVGLADEVRRRSAGSPVRALAAVRDVAVRIPVVVRGTGTSFVQALLDAGPDPAAMAAAARRALDGGLDIDPSAADVASVLAAGFPPWTGGVLHQLTAR